MLIYQHFIREKRPMFIQRMLESLRTHAAGARVEAFSTSNVLFFARASTSASTPSQFNCENRSESLGRADDALERGEPSMKRDSSSKKRTCGT
jgi:hypothetical protein